MGHLIFYFKINSLFSYAFNICGVEQQLRVPSYKSVSDHELIDLLKQNDRTAFSELYNRYAGKLTAFASSKLFSLDDVHDLIQDIFVNLWTSRQKVSIHTCPKRFSELLKNDFHEFRCCFYCRLENKPTLIHQIC